jgi:AcrR family transcriptional regulator
MLVSKYLHTNTTFFRQPLGKIRKFEAQACEGCLLSRSETRARIIEAAITIFGEKGYAASSTREIAERAGVREVTLFRHFGNKENLIREALTTRSPASNITVDLEEKMTGDLSRDLTYLANTYLERQLNRVDMIRIGVMEVPRNPSFAGIVRLIPTRLESHLVKYLRTLLEQQVIKEKDFEMLARMFYGVLFNHILMICSFSEDSERLQAETNQLVETMVSMFVHELLHEKDRNMGNENGGIR